MCAVTLVVLNISLHQIDQESDTGAEQVLVLDVVVLAAISVSYVNNSLPVLYSFLQTPLLLRHSLENL